MINLKDIEHIDSAVVKAPEKWDAHTGKFKVFLAGSIDNGEAVQWQEEISKLLRNEGITILNPRRDQWDSEANEELLDEQINWELDAMDAADCIVFYFAPGSKSPVTMLELGKYSSSGKAIVCCPEGFWRKRNVDIVCGRCGVETVNALEDLAEAVKEKVRTHSTPA